MNHNTEEDSHDAGRDTSCKYLHQYGNKVYLCKVSWLLSLFGYFKIQSNSHHWVEKKMGWGWDAIFKEKFAAIYTSANFSFATKLFFFKHLFYFLNFR